jgi:hypothetical protein
MLIGILLLETTIDAKFDRKMTKCNVDSSRMRYADNTLILQGNLTHGRARLVAVRCRQRLANEQALAGPAPPLPAGFDCAVTGQVARKPQMAPLPLNSGRKKTGLQARFFSARLEAYERL